MKPPAGGFGLGPLIGLGIGLTGFGYLGYKINDMNRNKAAYLAEGQTYMSPLVQKRLSNTFGWFGYGILTTSAFVFQMRNSSAMWLASPMAGWGLLAASFACYLGAHAFDYERQFPLKVMAYTAFTGVMGLAILPMIQMSSAAAVADAVLATGLSMTSLAGIAYLAPSEQFLNWGGALSMACMGMMAVSIMGMFNPASKALFNIWLWGGLGLTGALTLFHT